MDSWSGEGGNLLPPMRPSGRSVALALIVPSGSECPGRSQLCGMPLARGEGLCPSCSDTLVFDPRGSADLQRQIEPPATPECAMCRRPVPQAGQTCRRCLGQESAGASPRLQVKIETSAAPECPGDVGMCGAPLPVGATRCTRCRQQRQEPAAAAPWEHCKCGRRVLPGRGQCLGCRQAAGVSRIATFSADGPPRT